MRLAIILILCASPVFAKTVDPYHGPCTPVDALDNPDTWGMGKGVRLPPTCTPYVEKWDHKVFERAKGAPLTTEEHGSLFYRWHRIHDPERKMFGVDEPPAVPLPAAAILMMTALGTLTFLKKKATA